MPVTNWTAQQLTYALGSETTSNFINYFAVGSGSGAALVTNETLVAESGTRVLITGSPDFSSARKIGFTGDYTSVQMSGLSLREFGLYTASSNGSIWFREGFSPVVFDGTQELQLNVIVEVIPG